MKNIIINSDSDRSHFDANQEIPLFFLIRYFLFVPCYFLVLSYWLFLRNFSTIFRRSLFLLRCLLYVLFHTFVLVSTSLTVLLVSLYNRTEQDFSFCNRTVEKWLHHDTLKIKLQLSVKRMIYLIHSIIENIQSH